MLTIINCNFRSTKALQFPGSVHISFLIPFGNTYALSHWLPLPFPIKKKKKRRTLSHRHTLFEIFIAGNAKILGRKFAASKSDQLSTG